MNTGAAHQEIQKQSQHRHAQAPHPAPIIPHMHGQVEADPSRCLEEGTAWLEGKSRTFMPDRKAWAVSLLTALREARPTSEHYRTGYRHAVSVICSHIEHETPESEGWPSGKTVRDLTAHSSLGAHLAATRQLFNLRA